MIVAASRMLERELQRKEKALAETAALLAYDQDTLYGLSIAIPICTLGIVAFNVFV